MTNNGDGPARNVGIQAKLTAGLKHDSGQKSEEQILYELTLPELLPGQSEKLDPLVADAVAGGEQGCTVIAKSPDVDFKEADAQITRTISVVESKLKLTLKGPESRYTDTIGDYVITAENPGTAPARKVRILATLPLKRAWSRLPRVHTTTAQPGSFTGRSIKSSLTASRRRSRSACAWEESAGMKSSPTGPVTRP